MDLTWQWARRVSVCIMQNELIDSIMVSISLCCDLDGEEYASTFPLMFVKKEEEASENNQLGKFV